MLGCRVLSEPNPDETLEQLLVLSKKFITLSESLLLLKKCIVNGKREINYTQGVLNTLNVLYI